MKKIRLRVTIFPELDSRTLRTRNMNGEFEITLDEDDGRVEIVDESAPRIERDTTAFLGSIVKLEVEAKP